MSMMSRPGVGGDWDVFPWRHFNALSVYYQFSLLQNFQISKLASWPWLLLYTFDFCFVAPLHDVTGRIRINNNRLIIITTTTTIIIIIMQLYCA